MPRKFFRRLSAPYRQNHEQSTWYLRPFQLLLAHPVYISINRRSITAGLALGVFVGLLPFLGHAPVAVLLAVLLRVNVPVAVVATLLTNPLTLGPILYGEYRLGAWLMGQPPMAVSLDLPWEELMSALAGAWRPLWLGAAVAAPVGSALTYLVGNAAWRLITRRRMQLRAEGRRGNPPSHPPAARR